MALFHGGGVEPGLGTKEIRSRGLQLPMEEKVPPQIGSTGARALQFAKWLASLHYLTIGRLHLENLLAPLHLFFIDLSCRL